MLFSGHQVAYERQRKGMRNVACVAELRKPFFGEIDKKENRVKQQKTEMSHG